MRFSSQTLTLFFLASMATEASCASVVAECNTRLPMSLSTVVSDLEAEGVTEVAPACFLTSRGVTEAKKAELFGLEDVTATAFGTASGVCMALSTGTCSVPEAASTAVACEGNVVYYADEDDLARGEGLFDSLGPAIERILNDNDGIITGSPSLIVVTENPETTKARLEDAAVDVLANLVSANKKVNVLSDAFENVQYVKTADEALNLLKASKDPATAQESIASTVASNFWQSTGSSSMAFISSSSSSNMSPKDLAAARKLGPAARKALETAIETIKTLSEDNQLIVPNFGDLCKAASKRAMEELEEAAESRAVSYSVVGRQIRENLRAELEGELADLAEGQLNLLQEACFADFKAKLSKLRISPILATDMKNVRNESRKDFEKRANSMPNGSIAEDIYKIRLDEFCSERLLAARAGGQFKPTPRKGVTIGMHWLLPKPFGNDYRQEPWMVQATDNLVYIPPDKITDVSPEDVALGDWRSKIVPSPTGNEMVYMQ
uniref:Uncharacterized protein n=1 Tax=Pseudo-nitzschia australis TaxID=44445 RepID=A0A7S4EGV4_9STRA|eukprot:CAMPEP_0168193022 /NCGR_PEP_ID=MMETSP0139_2-20121125/18368_1 /TAXON_ID=44445 /ORGANISM="Pseudo-nitzschia australis, Strain 10249 10 AB" /LENGTH=494 /DNA_ID=CAMNT_0008116317 /DNA_START=40 /DNA_END=1524 /DNA_ORIENTATION=+